MEVDPRLDNPIIRRSRASQAHVRRRRRLRAVDRRVADGLRRIGAALRRFRCRRGAVLRIIAGEHRGRRLRPRKGSGTRPTVDRVRESLMSALSGARRFLRAVVLDVRGFGRSRPRKRSRAAPTRRLLREGPLGGSGRRGEHRLARLRQRRRPPVARRRSQSMPPRMAGPFDLVFLRPALRNRRGGGIFAARSARRGGEALLPARSSPTSTTRPLRGGRREDGAEPAAPALAQESTAAPSSISWKNPKRE